MNVPEDSGTVSIDLAQLRSERRKKDQVFLLSAMEIQTSDNSSVNNQNLCFSLHEG